MERAENTLAVTGSRRWSSSRMPAAWFTLRPLSSSDLRGTALQLLFQSFSLPLSFI
jgi:hypothetical protein